MRRWMIGTALGPPLLLWSCIAWAQEATQDWIPPEIRLPDDREVLVDRTIGSATRMFSFSTGADVDTLLDEWRAALSEGGYVVESSEETVLERQIEFSGQGIANAKIAIAPASGEERTVVEFDASLEN